MLYYALIVAIVVAAILMCFIVLVQNSKGGGLASSFSSSNQIMGVRKTTDFVEKATWSLAGVIVVLCIATAYVIPTDNSRRGSVIMEQAQQEQATNPMNLPDFGTPQAPATETPAETPAQAPAEQPSAE